MKGRIEKASADAEARAAFRTMTRLEPGIARAYLTSARALTGAVDMGALATAMQAGNFEAAEAALNLGTFADSAGPINEVFREGFDRGAKQGGSTASAFLAPGASAIYDPLDPFIQAQLRRQTAELVSGISNGTKKGIKGVMTRAHEQGMHPGAAAKHIRELVGLTERQSTAVDNLRARLAEDGVKQGTIDKRSERYAKKLHRQRAMTIARTESSGMVNAGRNAMWQKLEEDGSFGAKQMEKVWVIVPDERVDEECEDIDGEAVGLGEAFSVGVQAPPLHTDCRCTIILRQKKAASEYFIVKSARYRWLKAA